MRYASSLVVLALFACGCANAATETPRAPAPTTPSRSPSEPLVLPESAFRSDGAPAIVEATRVGSSRDPFATRRFVDPDPAPAHRYQGARIDLDVKNADVQEVFRLLADVGHVNVVVASEVTGSVTLKLTHVPWDQALDVIVRVRGLQIERDGNVILVRPASAKSG